MGAISTLGKASCRATAREGRKTGIYRRRRPAETPLYRVVQEHLETFLSLADDPTGNGLPGYVEQEFRKYLQCGILAHGFARARCPECGHDFLVAFSCKGRGVCPSCNARRMAETAAHLVDHVFPRLPVRQWVLSLPKRLRYFLRHDRRTVTAVLTIFLRVIEQRLRACSSGAAPTGRLGAVSFLHRFGSALNEHIHFHCCVIDGVFEPGQGGGEAVRFREAALTDADVQWGEPRPSVQWTFAARRTTGHGCPVWGLFGTPESRQGWLAKTRVLRWFARPLPGTRPHPWGLARKSAPGGFLSVRAISTKMTRRTWPSGATAAASRWMPRSGSRPIDRAGLERLLRYLTPHPLNSCVNVFFGSVTAVRGEICERQLTV